MTRRPDDKSTAEGSANTPTKGPAENPVNPPAMRSSRAAVDAFLHEVKRLAPATAADLGHCLPAASRHVSRGGIDRRARRAARLLSRARGMPRVGLGLAGRAAGGPDGTDRLPRR